MGVPEENKAKRTRRPRPFPVHNLEHSVALAQAIEENNAGRSYSRLSLAEAMSKSPESSAFRDLITSSTAYGLTIGSYNSAQIALTDLGTSVVSPRHPSERSKSLVEACVRIELFKKLYEHFDTKKIPPAQNFKSILVRDYGIDPDQADLCATIFTANGKYVGIIRAFSGVDRVSIQHAQEEVMPDEENEDDDEEDLHLRGGEEIEDADTAGSVPKMPRSLASGLEAEAANNRVFITHGKNNDIVHQLKELLAFGKFEPVVAAEHETISKPVPDKVMDDMRSCYAAIIHVGKEIKLLDQQGAEHIFLNQNVLVEIGAAMALYGRRFILLVERGATLPSNLQGLYEVRHEGDKLDYEATMKLLKAFNDFKQ